MKTSRFNRLFIYVILFVVFFNLYSYTVYADGNSKEFVKLESEAAVVIDSESGRILYEKNAHDRKHMASLTKVMTSILLVENCDMNEMIEVPKEAVWIGGSEVGLKKGDKISAQSLLYGMLLPSGNDCAYTVGFHIGGNIESFADMMTKKAKLIGANNTNFVNPHGLDNDSHYTTAYDMALITNYAVNNKFIKEAMNTKSITVNFGSFSKLLNNTNALLRTYDKADGGKTGFTNGANRCLVATASDSDCKYVAVILGAQTTKVRFSEAREILEECFSRYEKKDISDYLNFYINVPVVKGNIDSYERKYSDSLSIPLTNEEYEKIYIKQYVEPKLEAPIDIGTKIGKIEAYIEDEKIYEREIFLEENIHKKNVLDYMKKGLTDLFKPVSAI